MTDLTGVSDRNLVLEIYRRSRRDDEMGAFRNYCFRAALRPLFVAFDQADVDEANLRMYRLPDWAKIEAERDEVLEKFPE